MIKRTLLITIFIFALISLFTSCEKKTELLENKTDVTEQKILSFKDKINSTNKSNETLSIDSAVWYIEAALNYTHCNSEAVEIVAIDSIFVPININNENKIRFDNISLAYNQLNTNLLNILGENNMSLADIEFVENLNKNGEKQLKLTVVETRGIPNYWTFGEDDYWHLWRGRCDGSSDAYTCDEIDRRANYSIPILSGNSYVTDVQTNYYCGDEYTPEFFCWDSNHERCLSPSEMRYYLMKLKEFANLESIKPTNKSIIHYDLVNDGIVGRNWIGHSAWLTYGIWHTTASNPDL